MTKNRKTIQHIIDKKTRGEKIVMLTAYDYPFASLVDQSGVDIILVGDSLANVVLGLDSTIDVGMKEMIHHTKAVSRAVKNALLVGDMPYESYQKDVTRAVENAKRFFEEAGCQAVKLEWFDQCLEVAQKIMEAGMPVMGHVGLTPQTAEELGGFKVQGKDAASAHRIIDRAKALEEKGCFCIVLECVPEPLAKIISREVHIPVIGIGAGKYCDGQVLVLNDLLGLGSKHHPKFVKQYIDLKPLILRALKNYCDDVQREAFPSQEHIYSMEENELKKLMNDV